MKSRAQKEKERAKWKKEGTRKEVKESGAHKARPTESHSPDALGPNPSPCGEQTQSPGKEGTSGSPPGHRQPELQHPGREKRCCPRQRQHKGPGQLAVLPVSESRDWGSTWMPTLSLWSKAGRRGWGAAKKHQDGI